MFRVRNVTVVLSTLTVVAVLAVVALGEVTGSLVAALAAIAASAEVTGLLTFCKACSGAGMGGAPAAAGSAGSAGAGGPPPGCGGGGGSGPSQDDMTENIGTGLSKDAAMEAVGGKVLKTNTGKGAWGVIGIMVSLLMSGQDIYCGVQASMPLESGQQGMGKFNRGSQLDHWRAMNPDAPISDFPGYEE